MSHTESTDLERILREYAGFAHRLAASHEADPEKARDLAQDILVAVWRAWPAFRRQCTERTYVARIAHHRIATHIDRAVREPRFVELCDDLPSAVRSPEEDLIQADQWMQLLTMVRTLPIAYRQVALLLLEGFSAQEVADTLGVSTNAVAVRGHRARTMLRALLEVQK